MFEQALELLILIFGSLVIAFMVTYVIAVVYSMLRLCFGKKYSEEIEHKIKHNIKTIKYPKPVLKVVFICAYVGSFVFLKYQVMQ